MNNRMLYQFGYNLPADNHIKGLTDHFIEATAEWDGKSFLPSGKPLVLFDGPVMNSLKKLDLIIVKNWIAVFNDIEALAQAYFLDQLNQKSKNVVQIAEEVLV